MKPGTLTTRAQRRSTCSLYEDLNVLPVCPVYLLSIKCIVVGTFRFYCVPIIRSLGFIWYFTVLEVLKAISISGFLNKFMIVIVSALYYGKLPYIVLFFLCILRKEMSFLYCVMLETIVSLTFHIMLIIFLYFYKYTPWMLIRKRTIPIERPPLVISELLRIWNLSIYELVFRIPDDERSPKPK
jgi:hypothetical protein